MASPWGRIQLLGFVTRALCGFVGVECLFILSMDDLYHTWSMFDLVLPLLSV